jgi:hypothetical protein
MNANDFSRVLAQPYPAVVAVWRWLHDDAIRPWSYRSWPFPHGAHWWPPPHIRSNTTPARLGSALAARGRIFAVVYPADQVPNLSSDAGQASDEGD